MNSCKKYFPNLNMYFLNEIPLHGSLQLFTRVLKSTKLIFKIKNGQTRLCLFAPLKLEQRLEIGLGLDCEVIKTDESPYFRVPNFQNCIFLKFRISEILNTLQRANGR